jgi:uncharacterized SAM-binding protein YcdF (DUF218 family)
MERIGYSRLKDASRDEFTTLFNWLYLLDQPKPVELIIGFGHFDEKIPEQCATLYKIGVANRILFTGGTGAGSVGLEIPESRAFLNYIREHHPDIPKEHVLVEDKSTNTGENLSFSLKKISEVGFCAHEIPLSAALVATAYRQRRVFLTARKQMPVSQLVNLPPLTSYAEDLLMFSSRNQDLTLLLKEEIERILTYPIKGYIEKQSIPVQILDILNMKS